MFYSKLGIVFGKAKLLNNLNHVSMFYWVFLFDIFMFGKEFLILYNIHIIYGIISIIEL